MKVQRLVRLSILLVGLVVVWGALAPEALAVVGFRAATSASSVTGGGTITHVGAGAVSNLGNSCGSVTAQPAAGQVGDLLIASVNSRESSSVLSSPAGWTLLYASTYPGQDFKVRIYYRFASGPAPGADPITINQSANCRSLAARVARFRNVHPTTPFHAVPIPSAPNCGANAVCQNTNNIDTGTETTIDPNEMLLVASFVNDNSHICQGAGWSTSFESRLTPGRDLAFGLHYQLQTTAGAKSISNWSIDTNSSSCATPDTDENYGVILALRPAPALPSLTLNVPAGTVAGDVMLASLIRRSSGVSVTAPGGWTLIRQVTQSNPNSSALTTYYRVADGTEPPAYTWTFGSAGFGGAAGGIASFTGVDNNAPIDDEAGNATPSAVAHTAPSVTTTMPDDMLVTIHGFTSSRTWSPPAGMTEMVDISSLPPDDPVGVSIEINYELIAAPGSTGTRTATASGSADSGATQSVALRSRPWICYGDDYNRPSGSAGSDWVMSNNSGSFGNPLIAGNRLRLTDASGNVSTLATLQRKFPGSGNRIEVEFDYYAYGGSGADGIAFILSDYAVAPVPGGYGGSLGYAQRSGINGFAGGWLGVGIDEYGNFSNPSEGRIGGPGLRRDSVSVRGSGSGTSGYQYHAGTNTLTPQVDNNGSASPPHRYRIIVDHANSSNAMVSVERDTGSGYVMLVPPYDANAQPGQAAVPAEWILSFTGSTGGSTNIHEIDNLNICANSQTSLVGADHYAISHSGTGITCKSAQITITAHDSAHVPTDAGNSTITLTTSTGRGTWSAVITGGGVLNDPVAGDGAATYTYPGGESSVVLAFNYTDPGADPENINFDVSQDGLITEDAAEDPDLLFSSAGFVFTNDTDGNQTVTTQISGKASTANPGAKLISLQAVRVSDSDPTQCSPLFLNTVESVDFGAECRDPSSCTGRQVSVNGIGVSTSNNNGGPGTTAYTNFPNLAFDANGKAALILNYGDAGQMQLHARHEILLEDGTPSGNFMVGSSNAYVVRPFGLAFSNVRNYGADGVYDNGDDVLNLGGTASGGFGFVAAEDVFRVTLTGYQYQAADDTDGDGVPDLGADITDNGNNPNFAWGTSLSVYPTGYTPASGSTGSLGGTTSVSQASYSNGAATSVGDLTYDEVGSVILQAQATGYISAGINVSGYSVPVGRFFPDHFTLTAGSVTPGNGTFTYMAQPALGISYTLEARSLNDNLTSNYDSSAGYATGNVTLHAENNNDGTDLSARVSNPAGAWSGGVYVVSSITETVTRAAGGPDGPFGSLRLSVAIDSEQDSRSIANRDQKPDQANDCVTDGNCTTKAIGFLTDVRYGRLRLANGFGSELLPISVPVTVEYFDGSAFVLNGADNTSALTLATDYELSNPETAGGAWQPGNTAMTIPAAGNTNAGPATFLVAAGRTQISFTAPGVGNTGYVDIRGSAAVPAWLQFDWDPILAGTQPASGRATFGIYRGTPRIIQIRDPRF